MLRFIFERVYYFLNFINWLFKYVYFNYICFNMMKSTPFCIFSFLKLSLFELSIDSEIN